jgi:predicted nucleic acid-binding protein
VSVAYVDTSCLVSIAFGETGSSALSRRLQSFDSLVSSNLLEAEFLATLARERRGSDLSSPGKIAWIIPDRPLHAEIAQVLAAGYMRGADCWHLATALYFAGNPSTMSFLTLDSRQGSIARALGFGE